MNVKLISSLAGDRFAFVPRQVIKCSDKTGASLVAAGIGVEAVAGAQVDGELFDEAAETKVPPPRRRTPERADAPAPETPESDKAAATCAGSTALGNPCKRAPLPGSKFCAKHEED
jgi:hypothetical protein